MKDEEKKDRTDKMDDDDDNDDDGTAQICASSISLVKREFYVCNFLAHGRDLSPLVFNRISAVQETYV